MQSTLTYYGCNCDDASSTFSLDLATELEEGDRFDTLLLHIRLEYVWLPSILCATLNFLLILKMIIAILRKENRTW